jgi:transposase
MSEIRADHSQVWMFPPCLEDWLPADHPARFVWELVDSLPLARMGFKMRASEEGRPSYAVDLLLKVWLYGYLERIRSTRQLEKACRQNVALMWLTGVHFPDHNTLWRFWRDNRRAIKEVFRRTVKMAADLGLVGMVLHAVDGTKISARASTHKAWGRKRYEKLLGELDARIEQAMAEVEQAEGGEAGEHRLPAELADTVKLREKIRERLAELHAEGREHMNPAEPEAPMMKSGEGTRLAYNAQVVVDAAGGIIVAPEVTTEANDVSQLVPMLDKVKEELGQVAEETVADAGYFSGKQLAAAEEAGYEVVVNLQGTSAGEQPKDEYHAAHFVYDEANDCLRCPRGGVLEFEGTQYRNDRDYTTRRYRCQDFADCPVRWQCSRQQQGRTVKVSAHAAAIERQRQKQKDPAKAALLKRRMGIVEPVFARIKHLLGFRRWTVGGLEKVRQQWYWVCALANLMKLYPLWREGRLRLA